MADIGPVCSIHQRYLLVVPIPVLVDADGRRWIDPLWHKDMLLHLAYIRQLVLLAPRESLRGDPDAAGLKMLPDQAGFEAALLPSQETRLRALLNLPATLWRIFLEVRKADIVHSTVVGWPYPPGWPAGAFALLLRKNLFVVVESAPWRTPPPGSSLRRRLIFWAYELCARFFATRADLLVATQPEYISGLRAAQSHGRYAVHPATWIDAEIIVPAAQARQRWDARLAASGEPLRLLFASRLVMDKGAELVLELVRRLVSEGVAVRVSVIGDGEMRAAFEEEARRLGARFLQVLQPLPYGRAFFDLIAAHDAVLVPSLGDEQPRVVYDAYSQAVPVVASSTPGLESCVDDGHTGWVFKTGSVDELHARVLMLAGRPGLLREAGLAGRDVAEDHTHEAMHGKRCALLRSVFA
ncbi:MAG: glycosyltransferase family 4 protein [Steroidobacteraceae bacterium]